MELGEIIALVIIGALSGTAATSVMSQRRSFRARGGWLYNTVIGIAGALVGSFIFQALDLTLPDALSASVSLADLIVAFIGAIIVIVVVGFIQRR